VPLFTSDGLGLKNLIWSCLHHWWVALCTVSGANQMMMMMIALEVHWITRVVKHSWFFHGNFTLLLTCQNFIKQ